MSSYLPSSSTLNIGALSKVFDRTTNSYKYIFFIALLNCLEARQRAQA